MSFPPRSTPLLGAALLAHPLARRRAPADAVGMRRLGARAAAGRPCSPTAYGLFRRVVPRRRHALRFQLSPWR
ncbi:MAG: hypothetical protein MZW92_66170 [Comamonadaceae bacterium]|nr:hypothetical protein [Comamonadaceae bacterium]